MIELVSGFSATTGLQKACEEKDPAEMRNQIENIRASGLLRYLQEEVRETHYQLEFLERMPHGRQSILDMDKKTMSEIRRYHNPPPALHKVLQGAFLLLGEDEDTTDVSIRSRFPQRLGPLKPSYRLWLRL